MKTEIIPIEKPKEFEPFELRIHINTKDELLKFHKIAGNTVGFDYEVFDTLDSYIKSKLK